MGWDGAGLLLTIRRGRFQVKWRFFDDNMMIGLTSVLARVPPRS
jgi:hypothetical protein